MVKRIVLWKIKDDPNKQDNLNILKEGLLSLSSKIGDIVSIEVGFNFSSADYDIIFIVAFAEPHQLKHFQINPEYLKIFQHAQSISTSMIFCDYMVETSSSAPPMGRNMPNMAPGPRGLIGTNTGRVPNIHNISNPHNAQPNINSNGIFSATPKPNNLEQTKPFAPITNKTAPPFAGREYTNTNNPNNQYNDFNNTPNNNKSNVNFTVSENINQIRFASNKDNNMPPNEGTWKCSKCGKTNSSFINMCSCGRKKPLDNMANNLSLNNSMPSNNNMLINNNMPPNANMQPGNNLPSNGNMQLGNNMLPNGNMQHGNNMSPNGNMQGGNPNSMLLNSSLLPKVPSMPKSNMPNNNGAWLCPSCGKSNNEFMKVCVCGHRRIERNAPNNGPSNFNNNPSPMGFNGPNMNMPKNPSMGMNNIKSPNNNEFFNSFGGGNQMNGPGDMHKPNRPNIGNPNNLPPDSWKCPRCGKVLGNFVGQCVCGQRKPTRPMGNNGPGPNNTNMRFN